MKRIRNKKYSSDDTLIYSDKSRARFWLWHDEEGYRIVSERHMTCGSIAENPGLSLGVQLEDFNRILLELEGKKYKVARRWFLRYIRENFTFHGHSISEFQNPGSPYINWNIANEFDTD